MRWVEVATHEAGCVVHPAQVVGRVSRPVRVERSEDNVAITLRVMSRAEGQSKQKPPINRTITAQTPECATGSASAIRILANPRFCTGKASGTRSRSKNTRRAFSLIELLIVLAILAAITTLTLPALRGPMDKARLRGAGRDLETAIAKTRSLAIRTGEPHWFVYEPNGQSWRIETAPDRADSSTENTTASGLTTEPTQQVDEPTIVRTGELPDGTTFAESVTDFQTEPADVVLTTASRWSEPIRFSPIGRTTNRELTVTGTRDFEMQIQIRGLTGSVTANLRRRVEPTEGEELLTTQPELLEPTTEQLR